MFFITVWRVVWTEIIIFGFTYLSIHVFTDDENVVFKNVSDKGK